MVDAAEPASDEALTRRSIWPLYAGVVAAVVIGLTLFLVATNVGIGLSPDGIYYLNGAQTLLDSGRYGGYRFDGTYGPTTRFPPLYSAALAGLTAIGGEPRGIAGRALQAAIFATNIAAVAGLVWWGATGSWLRRQRRSIAAAGIASVVAALLVATSGFTLRAHAYLLTDGLAVTFMLASLAVLVSWLHRPRWFSPILLASLLSATFLLRYAAASLILYCGLVLLVHTGIAVFKERRSGTRPLRVGMTHLLSLGLLVLLVGTVLLGWTARNRSVAQRSNVSAPTVGRSVEFDPPGAKHIASLTRTVRDWIRPAAPEIDHPPPASMKRTLAASGIGCGLLVAIVLGRGSSNQPDAQPSLPAPSGKGLPIIFLGFALVYVGFLNFSITFFDRSVFFNPRLLMPCQFALAVGLPAAISRWAWLRRERMHSKSTAARWPVWIASIAVLPPAAWLLANTAWGGIAYASHAAKHGNGFTAPAWTESDLLLDVAALPEGTRIYSGAFDVVRLYANRAATVAHKAPTGESQRTGTVDPRFAEQSLRMADEFSPDGLAVYAEFENTKRPNFATPAQLDDFMSVRPIIERPGDGVLYVIGGEAHAEMWDDWAREQLTRRPVGSR